MLSYVGKGLISKLLFLLPWLWAAGRFDWLWAWLYIAIFIVFDVVTALIVEPSLLVERTTRHEDAKRWDTFYVSFAAFFLPLLAGVVAGLDERFGWASELSLWVRWVAVGFVVLGFCIVAWSMQVNAYFSAVVRIQKDRGHTVIEDGPYRFVRHPGYVGAVLFTLGLPLVLGSWWGFIPSVLAMILYVMRTRREDDTLRAELAGYEEFTKKTRYRLLPGVW